MKKPVVIDAIQWTKENDVELEHWLSKEKSVELEIDDHLYVAGVGTPYVSKIQIKTLEGTMEASYGDYIIKGINGEIYPCKPDIFEKTYEQPKKYLKWEDLEFKITHKIRILMNDNLYNLFCYDEKYIEIRTIKGEFMLTLDNDNPEDKQFFNDLHLERVEE